MNLTVAVSPLSNPLFEIAPASLQTRTFDLESKMALSHELSFPILFTGLTFGSGNLEKAKTLFKLTEIETFLEHNNDRVALTPLGFQEIISEKSMSVHAVAFISGFRAIFQINCNNNNTSDPIKLFWSFFTNVQVHGFGLNVSPNANAVIPLLNISELFNKHKRAEDLHETNILLGLALINARRFLQAAEVLRKSAFFFQKRPGKAFKAAKIQLLVAEAIKQPSMINEKMQAYFRATELFLGKSLTSNAPLVISCNYDVYTALLRISSHLCKFLVKMLYEKLDPLKIAAVRGLEFLMEYLGCSISSQLALILKTIILTYPLQPTHETEVFLPLSTPIQSQIPTVKINELPREMGPENQQTQKLLVDIYNHLLESFLNVLTSASSFLLRGLFIEIIAPNVFLNEMNGELRKFVFRIAEKITAICQGDLEINTSFVAALVQYLEGKVPQGGSLRLATQKLWESVKTKAIVNFPHSEARKLGDWVLESMQNIQENSKELSSIGVFIEIVRTLCARERKNSEIWGVCGKEMRNPLNTSSLLGLFEGFAGVLTLMIEDLLIMNSNNMSGPANSNVFGNSGTHTEKGQAPANPALPQNTPSCFDTIKTFWQCLLEVLNCLETPLKYICEVGFELLKKIGGIIAERAPSIQVLNSILMLFRTLEEFKQELPHEFLIDFFRLFCDCIPHSVYDESFMVFELLLRKLSDFLPSETDLIQKAINSLIDQFTVRSKAHKQAKSCLISVIKAQKSFETLFEAWSFTLFQNPEPLTEQCPPGNIEDILESSIKSNSLLLSGSLKTKTLNQIPHLANNFDSKQFNRNHESFLERLNFAEKLFEDLSEEQFQILLQLLKTPSPVYTSIQKLVVSGNAKVRLKGLKIVRKVLERFLKNRKNVSFFDLPACLLTKFVLVSVKICWEKAFSDPKLHFNGLLILDQLFQTVLGTPEVKFELNRVFTRREDLLKPNYTVIDIFNYEFPEDLKLSFEDDRYLHLRLFQILRLMPSISGLMNSSWSNIRSLAYGLVCYWVKSDVSFYKPSLMKNLLHSVFGILLGLLTSKESECRTGGLNILGSFCGFGFDFQKIEVPEILRFFRRFENIISQAIWESVFEIQNDWDGTNQAAAATLIQLAGPKELIVSLFRLKKEFSVLEYNNTLNNTNNNQGNQGGLMQNMGGSEGKKNFESVSVNGPDIGENINSSLDEGSLLWMERLGNEELQELIAMFRNEYKPPQNLWIERANYNEDDIEEDYDRFVYEADEVGNFFFEENNAQNGQKVYAEDFEEHPDNNMEDLGIIEVNDEEWNEYYSEELKTLKNHKSSKKFQTKGGGVERRSDMSPQMNNLTGPNMEKLKKNPEEKKIDEKAALRPHNPLFRPLTPPICDDSNEKKGFFEGIPPNNISNMDQVRVENIDNFNNLDDFDESKRGRSDFSRNRPNSGNKNKKTEEFFKRRDSAELFEMRFKEKSSSNSQKSEEDSKNESPLLPMMGRKIDNEKIEEQKEEIPKKSQKPNNNPNNRKSLDAEDLNDYKGLDTSTKLLQKLLETLQINQKSKNKVGVIEKMLKRQGSPNRGLLDNLLDSLKKRQEKTRSSSFGKKINQNKASKKKITSNKEKPKVKRNSGLKKRTKVQGKEEENETL